jgi:ketosteroid isomerase-like protein
MKNRGLLLGTMLISVILSSVTLHANAQSNDEKAIRALNQRFIAAVKAKDVNMIMSVYIPDESLSVFDAIPPRQYVGAKAYRKDFEEFLGMFPGPIEYSISDLTITAVSTLGYSHRIDSWTLTDKAGKRVPLVFRVTDVYRKINGKWLIVHEHVSFPVDPATGKADMLSKP